MKNLPPNTTNLNTPLPSVCGENISVIVPKSRCNWPEVTFKKAGWSLTSNWKPKSSPKSWLTLKPEPEKNIAARPIFSVELSILVFSPTNPRALKLMLYSVSLLKVIGNEPVCSNVINWLNYTKTNTYGRDVLDVWLS